MGGLPTHNVEISPALGASEWLLTNGLGGFAMGCADGVNRRRYHALLIGATTPPVGRVLGLSAIADVLAVPGAGGVVARHPLTDFAFAGWAGRTGTTPTRFSCDGVSASWSYAADTGIEVTRTLTLADGRNAAEIEYRVRTRVSAWLELRPLVALRDFHELVCGHDDRWRYYTTATEQGATTHAGRWHLHLAAESGRFSLHPDWWWNFEYAFDLARGQDGREDLYCPGTFVCECPAGESTHRIRAWMDDGVAPKGLDKAKRGRLERLVNSVAARHAGATPDDRAALAALTVAADQFVVVRDLPELGRRASIIAGYPWFSDWGRDSMIAIPGLLLACGRHAEALGTLTAFAALRRRGLVPNCFDDATGEAKYNTADASLWFIQASFDYLDATNDSAAFRATLLPACLDILRAYRDGTDFDIGMDPSDGLMVAGNPQTQITWMDAARDGVVFTPRHGKAVEINALWVSGLRRVCAVLDANAAKAWVMIAEKAAGSFARLFWNADRSCLFDRLERCTDAAGEAAWQGVGELRPNQVFAVSLTHSPLSRERQQSVLRALRDDLLTPVGLRSLAPGEPGYRGRFEGRLFDRDAAYHNGTVWPYLIGAYATGVMRAGGGTPAAKAEARAALSPLIASLTSAGSCGAIGSLAEVFDADDPRRPQGCPAQAWSVAEVLRAFVQALGA